MISYAGWPNCALYRSGSRKRRAACSSFRPTAPAFSSDHSPHSDARSMRASTRSPAAAIAASVRAGSAVVLTTPIVRHNHSASRGSRRSVANNLVDEHSAAVTQHPAELRVGSLEVGDVHQDVTTPDEVGGSLLDRQRLRRSEREADAARPHQHPAIRALP